MSNIYNEYNEKMNSMNKKLRMIAAKYKDINTFLAESGNNLRPDPIDFKVAGRKTTVYFADGTYTTAYCQENDTMNVETGLLICIAKKYDSGIFNLINKVMKRHNKNIAFAKKLEEQAKAAAEKEAKRRVKEHGRYLLRQMKREAEIAVLKEKYGDKFMEAARKKYGLTSDNNEGV